MTEQGVYKTIVQFPFFPVPLVSGGESWPPSLDMIRPQPCNDACEAACTCCLEQVD